MSGSIGVAQAISVLIGLGLIAGCAQQPRPPATRPTVNKPVTSKKKTRPVPPVTIVETVIEHCPSEAEIRRLRSARPKPLRDQKMPATTAERVAKTAAQLGLYEARGQWADQVEKALRQCDGR